MGAPRLGQCDVIIVSGDAYVDHPSFGTWRYWRLLESSRLSACCIIDSARIGLHNTEDFMRLLGRPTCYIRHYRLKQWIPLDQTVYTRSILKSGVMTDAYIALWCPAWKTP